jgi:hypothetical protein
VKKLNVIIAASGGGEGFLSARIPSFFGGEAALYIDFFDVILIKN